MKDINEIVTQLRAARDAYYNSDSPIMTDSEFDRLEETLRSVDPGNEYFSSVGIEAKAKIEHTVPMLSMQKGKSVEEIVKWMKKLKLPDDTEYCVQPKIDGLSASCCYENGRLMYIATRGDGTAGQDISHTGIYISDIPDTISFTQYRIEVRGELYLPKDTEFDTGGRPLRNNCVGLINRKENHEDIRFVKFAAFQITGYSEMEKESDVPVLLHNQGFNVVPMKIITSIDDLASYYEQYLEKYRNEWKFETDGLVITVNDRSLFAEIDSRWVVDHHHHYAVALKPPAESVETELVSISWQVSRQGNIIPVAVFKPVIIGGAKIERASLNNYDNVKNLDIRIGDTLLIERANDVIPYIRENISAHTKRDNKPVDITECPSCGSQLVRNSVHIRCTNTDCPEINIQKIIYWIKSSDIEQIGEETVRNLYKNSLIKTIKDLYSLTSDDLIKLEGFAEKKTNSIITEINQSKSMSAVELIAKLGIPLVQKKALKKLGILSLDDFYSFNNSSYVIGQNIIEWKENPNNISFLNDLVEICTITDENSVHKQKVCMTGKGPKGRKELAEDIESMGYEFTNQLTQDVAILLTDNPEGTGSKLAKARKYGIEIKSYDDFFS